MQINRRIKDSRVNNNYNPHRSCCRTHGAFQGREPQQDEGDRKHKQNKGLKRVFRSKVVMRKITVRIKTQMNYSKAHENYPDNEGL